MPALSWRVFALFGIIYLYAFPYFDFLKNANEVPRIFTTQEMVDQGNLFIDRRLPEMMSRQDLSRGPNGHFYQNKAPALTFLAVPVYGVLKTLGLTSLRASTFAFRVFVITLPALLFLPVFYRLAGRFTAEEAGRRTALVALALASPSVVYAKLFVGHNLAAVLAGTCFFLCVKLARETVARPRLTAWAAGFAAAATVAVDYHAIFAVLPIAVYFLLRVPRSFARLPFALLGAAPPAVFLAWYHARCFGSPWKTGYSAAPVDTSSTEGVMGIVGFSREAINAVLFTPSNGLLVLVPWTLLAFVGFVLIVASASWRRRAGAEAGVCLAIVMTYLLVMCALTPYMARGGWSVGPRYLTPALPFLAWLAAATFGRLDRHLVPRVITHGVVMASVIIFIAAAQSYPHWPDQLRNPLFELVFPLFRQGYAANSLGTLLGLRGLVSIFPVLLLALLLTGYLLCARDLRRWAGFVVSCALAVTIVVGHRSFPASGPYAQRAWTYITDLWEPRRER